MSDIIAANHGNGPKNMAKKDDKPMKKAVDRASYNQLYYLSNRELIRQKHRAYYEAHRGEYASRKRSYSKTPKGCFIVYRKRAFDNKLEFSLTEKDFSCSVGQPCSYCGETLTKPGFDRVNSLIGYRKDNVVPCCCMCNRMKLNHDKQKFLEQCKKIVAHQNGDPHGEGR